MPGKDEPPPLATRCKKAISKVILSVGISLLLTAPSSRKPLLQIVRVDSKFPGDERGFIAFIRINQEFPKASENSVAHKPSGFVMGALPQSLQFLVAYPWEGQRLPIRITPAELDRKSSAFRIYAPPSVGHFRQYRFQPL